MSKPWNNSDVLFAGLMISETVKISYRNSTLNCYVVLRMFNSGVLSAVLGLSETAMIEIEK